MNEPIDSSSSPESAASKPPASGSPSSASAPKVPTPLPARTRKASPPNPAPDDRRGFFNDAMREALGPFAGILERKINPLLAALEAIPDDVDRFTKVTLPSIHRTLDQPQLAPPPGPRNWPLDITQEAAPLTYLRPPGALPPGQFENVCSRCGKCVEVCPATAIKLDPNQLTADGLPHILARTQSCAVCTSLACMTECPSGALKLVDRLEIDMGTARVDHHLCRRDTGEDCRICIEFCPIVGDEAGGGPDAIVIHPGTGRVSVRKNTCVGCGLCENKCPTEPAAIRVVPARGPAEPIIS